MTTKECRKLFDYLVLKDKPQYNGDTNTLTSEEFLYYLNEAFIMVCFIDEELKSKNENVVALLGLKIPQIKVD